MEFGILGPLAVWVDGRELSVGPPRQRAVLALLLLRRGELVPTATIVGLLWGERPPATATKTVQVYVSQLRKALGADVVETQPLGYSLRVDRGTLDLDTFEELVGRARRLLGEGDTEQAADVLREALALWRGPPLADFRYDAFARDETARLEELRLAAGELRLEAELALGRHTEAVPELEGLVREHPLRESLRGLLMLALYRAGRQADALAAYKDARTELVEELGLEPSESLQQLETAILRHDPALDLPGRSEGEAPAVPPKTAGPEPATPGQAHGRAGRRRLVVVLGCGAIVAAGAVIATAVLLTQGGSGPSHAVVSADSVGIFQARSGRPSGQIPVGASPSAVTAGDGSIWVTNGDADSVSRVDPVKQVTIETIPVGNGPAGIAFGGGSIWVSNSLDGTVSRINAQTNTEVQRPAVGNGPAGVAVDSRYVWVANSRDGTVTPINRRTGKPLKPIPSGQSADGVAVGYGSVWVTSALSGSVTRIDARLRSVLRSIQAGSGADAVAVGLHAVWVANSLDSTVTRIDPATNTVRATIPVGDGPNGIAVADGAVWVSNELSGTLTKIDPLRNVPAQTVTTGNRPEGIVSDAGALFVAVRASGVGHRGGTLTVLTTSVGGLVHVDPALAYLYTETQLVALMNDGLTGFRKVGGTAGTRAVADLAVSLPTPSDDGRSYSFQLRPGIHYSTGALVRPQDFRRAIERTLELAGQGSFYASYYAAIVGARSCLAASKKPCDLSNGIVTDAALNTVTFHLTSPDPDFLSELALPAAFAVPAGTPLHPRLPLPATGPYEIASFAPKHSIRLVRNPRFREWSPAAQPNGFPDVIVERSNGSPDANVSAVLRGSADLAAGFYQSKPSPAVLASVTTQHPGQLKVTPWDGTLFLVLNTRVPPFDDVRVRQALNFAVDRTRLLDLTAGGSLGQVTCQVLPPDLPGYRPYCPYTAEPGSGAWAAPDLARARQLVRSSGTAGQKVTVWRASWANFPAAARYVASVLDSLGYKARVRYAAQPYQHADKLHLQAGFAGWYPDFASPSSFIDPQLTCAAYNPVNAENENFAEFCDPAIDREIARAHALQTSDPETASRLWAKIDRGITAQAPLVPFATNAVLEVISTRVRNYQYNPQWGTLLDQLWVK